MHSSAEVPSQLRRMPPDTSDPPDPPDPLASLTPAVTTREIRIGRARVRLDCRFHPDGSLRCATLAPIDAAVGTAHTLRSLIAEAKRLVGDQMALSGERQGPGVLYTSALTPADADEFLEAGFRVRSELSLLTKSFDHRSITAVFRLLRRHAGQTHRSDQGWYHVVRAPHEQIGRAADVDLEAFGPDWSLDLHDLRGALTATPSARLHLARRDGEVLGFVITGRAGRRGYLQRLAVRPGVQRGGVGAALVEASCRWAAAHDVARLVVNTQTTNTSALRLYQRAGFVASPLGLVLLELPLPGPHPPPGEPDVGGSGR